MPKRTTAEWVTVANVSRGTGHLFLEGTSDARVVRDSFQYPQNVDIRTADEIEADETSDHPLYGGNKRRLMELASAATKESSRNLLCFIDGDFSILISHTCIKSNLIETEYANLPVCTLTFPWLRSFFSKSYGFVLDEYTWKFICATLGFAFIARFISATWSRPNPAPELCDFISIKKSVLGFDNKAYIMRYFHVHDKEAKNILETVSSFIAELKFDIRHLANSNDVFEIIYALLRKSQKISSSLPREAIRQAYFGAFDPSIFNQEGFKKLRDWIALYP